MAAHPSDASATFPGFVPSAEGARCPALSFINKDVKQHWPQYQSLMHTAGDWPPTGLHSVDHNPRPSAYNSQLTAASIYLAEALSLLMPQWC